MAAPSTVAPAADGHPDPSGRARSGRHHPWIRRGIVAVGVVAVLVVLYIGITFVQVWRAASRDDTGRSEAIVVLGAAQYDGRPSPVLEARLQRALDLYEAGVAPRIVVTGGRQQGDTFTEATSGYNWLRERGVPDEAILKEVQGRNTYESLAATSRFLRSRGIEDVTLVSDDYHALRVSAIAEEVGMDPRVSTVDTGGTSLPKLARETIAVGIGRITGYRRLNNLTG